MKLNFKDWNLILNALQNQLQEERNFTTWLEKTYAKDHPNHDASEDVNYANHKAHSVRRMDKRGVCSSS